MFKKKILVWYQNVKKIVKMIWALKEGAAKSSTQRWPSWPWLTLDIFLIPRQRLLLGVPPIMHHNVHFAIQWSFHSLKSPVVRYYDS